MKEPHFGEKKTSLIIITNKHNITDYFLNQQREYFIQISTKKPLQKTLKIL